jgi:hypothetical protein
VPLSPMPHVHVLRCANCESVNRKSSPCLLDARASAGHGTKGHFAANCLCNFMRHAGYRPTFSLPPIGNYKGSPLSLYAGADGPDDPDQSQANLHITTQLLYKSMGNIRYQTTTPKLLHYNG